MLLIIHYIDEFEGPDGDVVSIGFNYAKKKFFGKGYSVKEGPGIGELKLTLTYTNGKLTFQFPGKPLGVNSSIVYCINDGAGRAHWVDAMDIGKILSAAKNSPFASEQLKKDLLELFRSKDLIDNALGDWSP